MTPTPAEDAGHVTGLKRAPLVGSVCWHEEEKMCARLSEDRVLEYTFIYTVKQIHFRVTTFTLNRSG